MSLKDYHEPVGLLTHGNLRERTMDKLNMMSFIILTVQILFLRVIKSRRMRLARYAARTKEMRYSYKVLVVKAEGN
jgi:hypothetical protein